MRYIRLNVRSRTTLFLLLMAGSAACLFLPRDMLTWLRRLTEPLATAQTGVRKPIRLVAETMDTAARPAVSADAHEETLRQKEVYENEIVSLRGAVARLRETNAELMGIRERGLAADVRLVPAVVAGFDAAPGRASMHVPRGKAHDVDEGAPVTTNLAARAGTAEGVDDQAAVIARECLIGWVEEVFPHHSRVVLLSDRQANRATRVQIPTPDGDPIDLVLEGAGRGRMLIHDIPARLVIGPITSLTQNRENRLYYDAVVEHRWDPRHLAEVYIVDVPGP